MKFIITVILIAITGQNAACASELKGKISTDPEKIVGNNGTGGGSPVGDHSATDQKAETQNTKPGKGFIAGARTEPIHKKESEEKKGVEKVKVLGLSHLADNSLVRDKLGRIFLVKGGSKKYIPDLKELKKYLGKRIHPVDDDILGSYELRNHADGELVREKGGEKVYVIDKGKGKHILNLEQLRKKYAGREIFNISAQEMIVYAP